MQSEESKTVIDLYLLGISELNWELNIGEIVLVSIYG